MTDAEAYVRYVKRQDGVEGAHVQDDGLRVNFGMKTATEKIARVTGVLGAHGEVASTFEHWIEVEYPLDELAELPNSP